MGDRFYNQQKNYKPKRIYKKDIINDLEDLLGCTVKGVDRMTIDNLQDLIEKIENKLVS